MTVQHEPGDGATDPDILGPDPANTRRLPNAGAMLVHRLRRWTNIVPALGERLVFPASEHILGPRTHMLAEYENARAWVAATLGSFHCHGPLHNLYLKMI